MKEENLDHLIKKIKSKTVPFAVVLEITERCNLACLHCYQGKGGEELKRRELKSLLDALEVSGTMKLTLTGGEPTLREDFPEILSYCHQKGFATTLFTNATHLPENVKKAILETPPFAIECSLYGASAKTHDAITCKSGSFQDTLENIKWMTGKGLRVVVKSVVLSLNYEEIDPLRDLCRGMGIMFHPTYRIFPSRDPGRRPERFRLKNEQIRALTKEREQIFPKNQAEDDAFSEEFICNAGRQACCISADGKVYPCVALRWQCGSMREQTFPEIWNRSPVLEKIRSYREEDFGDCFLCKWKSFCKFCPGLGFSERGDMRLPSEEMCRLTKAVAIQDENDEQP